MVGNNETIMNQVDFDCRLVLTRPTTEAEDEANQSNKQQALSFRPRFLQSFENILLKLSYSNQRTTESYCMSSSLIKLPKKLPHILHHLLRTLHTRKMPPKLPFPEELQICRRRLRPRLRHRKRIIRKRAHSQGHPNQILILRVELSVHFVPHIVVVAQHTRHDARRSEEVEAERGADIVVELGVLKRCGAEIGVC
jgi:hypothetical protein